jgi:pyruvate formate lyase activating enzyme
MKEAQFYEKTGAYCKCQLCPHKCLIAEGKTGLCRVRGQREGKLIAEGYGRVSALGLDPIEKKPLHHFYPGAWILSLGSYGCNMHCNFCQNSAISQDKAVTEFYSPEELLYAARRQPANIGLAFTYNEPLINIEYILDTAPLLKEQGLKVVLVTNGLVCAEPLAVLLPHVDALNIDVKSYAAKYYRKLGGDLQTVKQTVESAAKHCHVEVTTLIVPEENDSAAELEALSEWLAAISPAIPLHLSRFFPRYHMMDKPPTPLDTLNKLAAITRRKLKHVYIGNIG